MKKIWIIAMLVLLLCGCGAQETFETLGQVQQPVQADPWQILLDLRMKQAADMLRNCSLSIQEIAAEIGYTNRSYFHKCFQEYHGMTPAAYRQTHKITLE